MSSAIGWVGLAVVAGASVAGGVISAQGAKSAAQTQANALQAGQNATMQQFNTMTAQQQPYMQSGYGAMDQLNYLMGTSGGVHGGQQTTNNGGIIGQPGTGPGGVPGSGIVGGGGAYPGSGPGMQTGYVPGGGGAQVGPAAAQPMGAGSTPTSAGRSNVSYRTPDAPAGQSVPGGYGSLNQPFTADMMKQYSPAYQFQLQQGGQGVLNAASMNQGAESGATMKDLMGYTQNLANTSFNNAFSQYQTQQGNTYNRLMGISQLGQNAAANTGAQGTALAGNQASLMASQGASLAAGQVGAANAYSGAISNVVPWLMMAGK